jgi:hypothetical protein
MTTTKNKVRVSVEELEAILNEEVDAPVEFRPPQTMTPDEILKRTIDLLNRMVRVDKEFVLQLLNSDFRPGSPTMDAVGDDEIPIVVGKRDGEWSCSMLGIVNGVLLELGAGRIQVECEMSDGKEKYPIVDVSGFSEWRPQ